jgi:mono/diheme cytochrome c family protein
MPSARALLRFATLRAAIRPATQSIFGSAALITVLIVGLPACGETTTTGTISLTSTLSPSTRALNWGADREQLFADILEHEVGTWESPTWPKTWSKSEPPSLLNGRAEYVQNCADCHGLTGHGDGPNGVGLARLPRDFSAATTKYKTTGGTSLPLMADLDAFVTRQLSARPKDGCPVPVGTDSDVRLYLDHLLRRHALERSVASALNQVPAFTQSTDPVEREMQVLQAMSVALLAIEGQRTEEMETGASQAHGKTETRLRGDAALGRELYTSAKGVCATCHGHDGAGKGPQTWEPALGGWMLKDMWGNPAIPGDFTQRPWRSGDTPADLERSIRIGIGGTPMPAYDTIFSEVQIADLVAYILTLSE